MTEFERHQKEELAAALQAVLTRRGLPTTGQAIADVLQAHGVKVNPYTAGLWVSGERMPYNAHKAHLLAHLCQGDADRALLTTAFAPSTPRRTSSIGLGTALTRLGLVNRGRQREELTLLFTVGETDEDDSCEERRRTYASDEGLSVIGFRVGQTGPMPFDLLNLPLLEVELLKAHRVGGDGSPVRCSLNVVQIDVQRQAYKFVVQFHPTLRNEAVDWGFKYKRPGLWRSLRTNGRSAGSLTVSQRRVPVDALTIAIEADEIALPDLRFGALSPADGTTKTGLKGRRRRLWWHVRKPEGSVTYEVLATPTVDAGT